MKNKEQLSLLVFGNMDVATQSKSAFQLVERKDDQGNLLSQTFALRKNKELAEALGLDVKADSDKLAEAVMADSDAQLDRMIRLLQEAKADKAGYWTGGRSKLIFGKRGKSGKISRAKAVIELIESRRSQGPSEAAWIDKMARAYQAPGESLEDAIARVTILVDKQKAELEAKAKEMAANTHDAGGNGGATTPQIPEKTEDQILAEMEAEELAEQKAEEARQAAITK